MRPLSRRVPQGARRRKDAAACAKAGGRQARPTNPQTYPTNHPFRLMQLRPYQRAALEALWRYFEEKSGNPLLVVPTGGGKSWIQAAFIRGVLERYPSERFLCLSHVKELIAQNAEKLEALLPFGSVGIYSAGLRRRELGKAVTVASVQSIYRRACDLGPVSIVMIDECHRVPTRGEGMYRQLLADLRVINSHVKVIGLSATPFRMKSGWLHQGDDSLFTDIAYEVPVLDLIEQGYLSKLRSKTGVTEADLSRVRIRGGEYVASELEAVMNQDQLIEAALDEVERFCAGRRKWLVFCAGVDHARAVRDAFRRRGMTSECVTGDTPHAERDDIIARFKAGAVRALTNVAVLTTGFDAPDIDAVVMMRPTQSPGLYAQIVGRGLRIAPGKDDCLILDFAGNIARHGPIDRLEVSHEVGGGPAPGKVCPECRETVWVAATECPECGFEFPMMEPGERMPHETKASSAPILSTEETAIETVPVERVEYARHEKLGKPPSLRVTYWAGLASYREWVCLEHEGFARRKAHEWWARRSPNPPPESVDEALDAASELVEPDEIVINTLGKYPEIIAARFAAGKAA